MKGSRRPATFALVTTLVLPLVLQAQSAPPKKDAAIYQKHADDPVLKEMEDRDKKAAEDAAALTEKIVDEQEALKRKEEESKPDLRFDMKGIARPSGPDAFQVKAWFSPPVAQYLTGTCWSFSTTSYFESEVKRLSGKEIKLSEMWNAYHEYLDRARRYVSTRGNSPFEEGSETEAVARIWKVYGTVPEQAYPGICAKDGRHDHVGMVREMQAYLAYCKANNSWDEGQILDALKEIMNKTMGAPPAEVKWEGRTYTPQAFLKSVCRLDMDDYASFVSTTSLPFWTVGYVKLAGNWWKFSDYHNLPLDVWYGTLLAAVKAGSTTVLEGDVDEPGYSGEEKIAVIPSFDVPEAFLDQDAREFRFDNGSTADEHNIHLVGWTSVGGADWFLIKDSARAARKTPPEGYLYYRADYVKLKMLTYTLHKDFAKDVLAKFGKP